MRKPFVRTYHPVDESGSNIVQTVLVIPFITVLAVFIVQLAIFSFESSVVASQISRAIAASDLHGLVEMNNKTQANQTLSARIQDNIPVFQDSTDPTFFFEDSTFSITSNLDNPTRTTLYKPDSVVSDIRTVKDENTTVHVTGVMHYKVPAFFAYTIFDGLEITRKVDITQTGSGRLEFTQEPQGWVFQHFG